MHHLGPACSVARPAAHQLAAVRCQSRGSCFTTGYLSQIPPSQFIFPLSWFCGRPYRYISYQQSPGSRSRDRDGRNLERVQGKGDLWQRGVSPGGHGTAGLFWILYESSGPKRKRVVTGLDTRGIWGFSERCSANIPLWRRQSVP